MSEYYPPKLPLKIEIETKAILKLLPSVRAALGELKGIIETIPNQNIILNSLSLQEAKASSAIENIVTTQDELYKSDIASSKNPAAKEIKDYANSLLFGYEKVKEQGLLTNNTIKEIQKIIEGNRAGFRTQAGTTLKNNFGEIIYTPPQSAQEIIDLMSNLEEFINEPSISDLDPLIKMAVIHHQFESIHPFYDGNGRTGRIINILYLVLEGVLNLPVLYLSKYIIDQKTQYYTLLQSVRDENKWEDWILWMLKAIETTALDTIKTIKSIKIVMFFFKSNIRSQLPNIYSQDLINSLFKHPYTKIEFLSNDLGRTRKTASKYLEQLAALNLLETIKLGRNKYFINKMLIDTLNQKLIINP